MTGERVALVLNSGSSSLKFAAFDITQDDVRELVAGQVDPAKGDPPFAAIDAALAKVGAAAPVAIGHRIVHGGPKLLSHCRVDDAVLGELSAAERFAPLHVPPALALLERATLQYPDCLQIACFDTAFHADMPSVARTLPIPHSLRDEGVHRYGFHGLSCESVVFQLGDALPGRLVVAHLGNGASVTAVRDGRSIDTSMGLTPSGGVIMSTRTGDIDPGVLIHLLRTRGCDPVELERLIDKESGLLGISGLSGDMRALHAARGNPGADLAVAMFVRSVAKQIAAMMTSLGGADAIVFTGGIGEHDPLVRQMICHDLAWAGVTLSQHDDPAPQSCPATTLPSREEHQIARHMQTILAGG
ncbi:acetate/propionate family kinase [Sphingomonas radiodurans]|uniref:acetate/propionate family kinase n=1 Tax=Sphingomonas radiodurans TaxID=2890321 RepID=UPI001E560C03|nr:acetate kinase [Sphingomonas radiodurans]WBH17853.1 acetate kinase [Sphingomonas radiodurans]